MMEFITHQDGDCWKFFENFANGDRRLLFIGTLGFNEICLSFPKLLAAVPAIDFLFLIEERPDVSPILKKMADQNRECLQALLSTKSVRFESIAIVADDTATVAGRRATAVCAPLMKSGYSDIVIDASSMSRGVCFPVVKQAYEMRNRQNGPGAHVVTAGRNHSVVQATSMSSDTPQYVHGFHSDMETDDVHGAIKLWIPQLSEGAVASLGRIHRALNPEESCPILPFPAANPRRGDLLLQEFQEQILTEWDVNLLDVIYAHESDPTDVCDTITRIHSSRAEAFLSSTTRPPRTVLSPSGSRIGSVGMLLAALRLDLPIMYEESIGYTCALTSVPKLTDTPPDHLWHIWLR